MLLEPERKQVIKYCQKLLTKGLTIGTGGNISLKNRLQNLIAISPSGLDYFELECEDIVIVEPQGTIIDGKQKPSTELKFHLALYQQRPELNAIVHTHSVNATTVACLGKELPPVHYLIGYSGDKVPLVSYFPPGTPELANAIAHTIGNYNALLLENHGMLAVGKNLESAFTCAESIEFVAKIYCQCQAIGQPKLLTQEQIQTVIACFYSQYWRNQ